MLNFRGVVDQGSLSKLRACSGYFGITSSTVVLSKDLVHVLISVLFFGNPCSYKIIIKATIHKYALNCPGRWKMLHRFFSIVFHVLHSSLVIEAVLSLMPPAPIAWVFTQSPCNDWLPALAWGRGQQTPFSAFNSTLWVRKCEYFGPLLQEIWKERTLFLWYCK